MIQKTYYQFTPQNDSLTINCVEARSTPKLSAHQALQLILDTEKNNLQNSTANPIQEIAETIFQQYSAKYNTKCFIAKWVDYIIEACGGETELRKLQVLNERIASIYLSSDISAETDSSASVSDSEEQVDQAQEEEAYLNEILKVIKDAGAKVTAEAWGYWVHKLWLSPTAVQCLIDNEMSPNMIYNDGLTPFHRAVRIGNQESMQILLDKGAEIEKRTAFVDSDLPYDFSPLNLASMCGNLATVKFLINSGASIEAQWYTWLPSQVAGRFGGWDEVTDYLRSEEEKLGRHSYKLNSYLHTQESPNAMHIIKVAISYGANLEARNGLGETPLQVAARSCNPELMKYLIDLGVDSKGINHAAISSASANVDDLESFKLVFAKSGIPPKTQSDDTALHIAACHGNADIVQFLLENGASASLKDRNIHGQTPLHLAVMGAIFSKEASYLHRHKKEKFLEIIKTLVGKGADINAEVENGNTPLMLIIQWADYTKYTRDLIKLILDLGADPEKRNAKGRTALSEACASINSSAVQELLSRNVELNTRDLKDKTSLELLFSDQNPNSDPYGKGAIMSELLSHEAEVFPENADGELFLHTCIRHLDDRWYSLIEKLIDEKGIGINQKDAGGNSPLELVYLYEYPVFLNKPNIIKVLLKKGAPIPQFEEGKPYLHRLLDIFGCTRELLQIIIERGDIDVREVSSSGSSIISIARKSYDISTIEELFGEKK